VADSLSPLAGPACTDLNKGNGMKYTKDTWHKGQQVVLLNQGSPDRIRIVFEVNQSFVDIRSYKSGACYNFKHDGSQFRGAASIRPATEQDIAAIEKRIAGSPLASMSNGARSPWNN